MIMLQLSSDVRGHTPVSRVGRGGEGTLPKHCVANVCQMCTDTKIRLGCVRVHIYILWSFNIHIDNQMGH